MTVSPTAKATVLATEVKQREVFSIARDVESVVQVRARQLVGHLKAGAFRGD